MGQITDAAKTTYSDGPMGSPSQPSKVEIIRIFQTIEVLMGSLIEGLVIGNAVVHTTRAILYADLDHGAGTMGVVFDDSTDSYNGIYIKSGASGSGGWSITNLAVPSSFVTDLVADLSAVAAEVAGARGGEASLDGRLDSIATNISGRASQGDLDETNAVVALKADQSALDETNDAMAAKQDASAPLAALSMAPEATAEWIAEGVRRTADGALETVDPSGFVGHRLDEAGISGPGFAMLADGRTDLSVVDADGFAGLILGSEGLLVGDVDDTLNAQLTALSEAPEDTANWLADGIRRTADGAIETIDEDGFVGHGFNEDGMSVPGLTVVDDGRADLSISDPDGMVGFILGAEGLYVGAISDDGDIIGVEFSESDIKALNAECLAASALAQRPVQSYQQRTTFFYNSIFSYGQSLSDGWEGWPRLSTATVPGLYMIGESPRPNNEDDPAFVPIGGPVLNPLTATVQVSATLYDDAAVAAFTAGDNARGETIGDGAVRAFRLAQLQHFAVDADATRNYIYSACGSGGNSMADLTYGATPHLFNRLIDAAELVKGIADTASKTSGAVAVLWNQGEADYIEGTEPDDYKAGVSQIIDDFHDQVQVGVFGASRPVAWFTCQTGAYYARDHLEIAQAQRELADERQDVFMVAPNYAATDKGDHLDSNGYRWLACQTAKVMHLVLNLGQNWVPLQERRVLKHRSSALVGFTVPVPPLRWLPVYEASTPVIYANKGFTATDAAGALPISSVAIVADCVVQIIFGREISGELTVLYGTKTASFGGGNLADSDQTVAPFDYEYLPGSGMYAAANIPELVGKPYPLNNYCLAFIRQGEV